MRPTDSPARRLSVPARGKGDGTLDAAQDALLESRGEFVGQVRAVLGDRVAPAHRALDLAAAPAQLALDAHARFAHLALEPVASGGASTLEAAPLRLRFGGGRV